LATAGLPQALGGFEALGQILTIEIDHIFVFTVFGAPQASRLIKFDLTEKRSKTKVFFA